MNIKSAKKVSSSSSAQTEKQKNIIENFNDEDIYLGLYHGDRRVRAKWDKYDGWRLSSDETDLIAALGQSNIKDSTNRADLQIYYGLTELEETRPITDNEWGEGAKVFCDRRPWYKKISYLDILIILIAPHIYFTFFLISKVVSHLIKKIAYTLFIAPFFIAPLFDGFFGVNVSTFSTWERLGFLSIVLYLWSPVFFLMMATVIASNNAIRPQNSGR